MKSSVLVSEHDIQLLKNRVSELKNEKKSIERFYNNEILLNKKLYIEKNAIESILKEYKISIKNEFKNKFGIEKDWSFLNNMEMDIINCMIIETEVNPKKIENRFTKEVKMLEVSIYCYNNCNIYCTVYM